MWAIIPTTVLPDYTERHRNPIWYSADRADAYRMAARLSPYRTAPGDYLLVAPLPRVF